MTAPIARRPVALEQRFLVNRGVVGFCTPRGGTLTPGEAAVFERRVSDLHRAGYALVYVGNLTGRLPAVESAKHRDPMP